MLNDYFLIRGKNADESRLQRTNERSGTVIAVALTSQPQRAGYPLTFELVGTNLPKKSWVKISQIRTLSVKRIRNKISKASEEELTIIVEGLNEITGG
jgi:mRNA interferase MazF